MGEAGGEAVSDGFEGFFAVDATSDKTSFAGFLREMPDMMIVQQDP